MNKETMYILMKNSNSLVDELHIFEMKFVRVDEKGKPKYTFFPKTDQKERYKCLCKALENDEVDYYTVAHYVYNEKDMRTKCANIGRQVCGVCISTLYGDFSKKR